MISVFSKVNKFILSFPLFFIVLLSCNDNKEEYNQNKKNDLTRLKLRGPIKQVKETHYNVENKFGEFVKKYPAVRIANTYFDDNGFIWRYVKFSAPPFLDDYLKNEYDERNRIIKTIISDKIDKVKSANYENDPQGTVMLENPSIDTFIYSNNAKSSYKIINEISNKHPSWTEKYNNKGKIIEKIDYTDGGITKQRTLYNYNDSSKLISEYVYDSNSIISKTDYDYFPNKKVTIYQDSNYYFGKPLFKTEYFDSTEINIVKEIQDAGGLVRNGYYAETAYEYDSLSNITKTTSEIKSSDYGSIYTGPQTTKHVYSDYDKFGNWRIKQSFEYDENMGVYIQYALTERIIEPNLELIKQKENESLQNSWLYILIAITPFIFMVFMPTILSFFIVLISIFSERNKLLTKLIVVFAGASSIILYVITASIFYLIFTSYEFPRFGKDWFLKQIPTLASILLSLLLMSYHKNVKELKKSDAYVSSSNIVVFHYYADYSRTIMGKMTFTLFIYFVFLFSNISVDNSYFNTIREFIIKHF